MHEYEKIKTLAQFGFFMSPAYAAKPKDTKVPAKCGRKHLVYVAFYFSLSLSIELWVPYPYGNKK